MYLGNLRNRPNTSLNAKSVIKRIVRGLKERQVLWQEGSLSIVYMPMDDSRTACNRKLRQLYLVIRKHNGETSVSSRALIIRSPKEPTGYMPANAFSTEEAALAYLLGVASVIKSSVEFRNKADRFVEEYCKPSTDEEAN